MDEPTGGTMTVDRPAAREVHALRVRVTRGPDQGATTIVDRQGVILGRAPGAGLRLTDATVSSFHAELVPSSEGVVVRDLSSQNGTFFAGARLLSAVVPSGSMLEVGGSVVLVELDTQLAAPEDHLASFGPLRGASGAMRAVFFLLARLATTEASVLLEGAAGTGKEVAARALHEASRRGGGPLVVFDCGAVPSGLAESVLFGREGLPEPGADEPAPGVFEAADGGTLLLKEVGSLTLELQSMLLRVLDAHAVTRVGGTQPRPLRTRVLASTRRDLREMVNASGFREDLYMRLAQARVVLPPLAGRQEDIMPLAYHFLQSLPSEVEGARTIARDALDELKRREYRGNVRELRATIERVAMLARGNTITVGDLAFERLLSVERERATGVEPVDIAPFKEAKRTLVDEFERDYLKALLLRAGENLSRASAISGVERHHLRNLFRKHALGEK